MDNQIYVLQLGDENWIEKYQLPATIVWNYWEEGISIAQMQYDVVIVDRSISRAECDFLRKVTSAHGFFVTDSVEMTDDLQELYAYFLGQKIARNEISDFLIERLPYYFKQVYGSKLSNNEIVIAPGYKGKVNWKGNVYLELAHDFGEVMSQVAFWRENILVRKGQMRELWLEYEKAGDVKLELSVIWMKRGEVDEILKVELFDEETLLQPICLKNSMNKDVMVFVSLRVCGSGTVRIISLHQRRSRNGVGQFLPGDERYVLSNREEIFCYFDPGNWKPPFNVYFSGYKTWEGFEGYRMMKEMGHPFLLISESRLEGGNFYLGNDEYEFQMVGIIEKYQKLLGFDRSQLILSGLSMGAFGAMYYGCHFMPHALLLGTPLASLGNVAVNERMKRPGIFPTSLDVLMKNTEATGEVEVRELNRRLWKRFDEADWSKTKLVLSYMLEDDYDTDAYEQILEHLKSDGVQIYGRGVHGRHNDNTDAIVEWFTNQYRQILVEDFGKIT